MYGWCGPIDHHLNSNLKVKASSFASLVFTRSSSLIIYSLNVSKSYLEVMALTAGLCCKWGRRKPFKMIYRGLHSSLGSLGSWFYGGFAFICGAVNCIVAGQGILVYNTVWYNKKGFTITSIFFRQMKDSLTRARYSFLQTNKWMNICNW